MSWFVCAGVERIKSRAVVGSNLLCFLVVLVSLGLSRPIYGQAQNSGSISGRVTDSTGAVVRGAAIVLKSPTGGREDSVSTNGKGEFVLNGVAPGSYNLTVTAKTFASYTFKNVMVDAGTDVTLDTILHPASETLDVTVDAPAATVDAQSATIATVIDQKLVEGLPLDGNNVIETAALLPGVTNVNAPATFTSDTGGPTYNVSGARSNQNLLLLDGALWNNLYSNTGLSFPPGQALQEVSVILNNYKAQYGRNVGSVFNVITRSGSNQYHGRMWEFLQNKIFNASDYISGANPHLASNQFGASLGGPIKRDKLFFFLTFQNLRVGTVAFAQAPTLDPAERGLNADGTPRPCITPAFAAASTSCAYEDQAGTTTVTNPRSAGGTAIQTAWTTAGGTGTSPCLAALQSVSSPLPNNEIPSICFNPVTVALLSTQPLPNRIVAGEALAISSAPLPRSDYEGLARVDWNLGRHTVAARYYQTSADDRSANGVSAGVGIASYEINLNYGAIHAGIIDDTWVVKPNLLNVVRAAYKRYDYNVDPADSRSVASFGSNFTSPGHPAPPRLSIGGRFVAGTSNQNYVRSVNEDIEADDSLTWTKGTHNVQVGGEYLRLQYLKRFDQQPSFSFNNTYTGVPAADYLLGLVSNVVVGNSTNQAAIQHDLYLYAQDDWRLTSKLTLNYGIRYELPMQWYQPDGQSATFIPGYQSQVFPTAPANLAFVGDYGVKKSLVGTDFKNVAPRFGLAYDVFGNGRTTIKAGFGIFYDAINALVVGVTQPYHYSANYANPKGGLSQPLLGYNPVPANYVKGQPPQFVTPYSITFPDQNFTTPYTEAVNLGVQQVIKKSVLEIHYIGRMGRHQALGYDLNPAIYDCSGYYFQLNPTTYCTGAYSGDASYQRRVLYPNFNYGGSGALDYMSAGSSSYNSGLVIYRVRAKSMTLLLSYDYSKSLDDSSSIGIGNTTDQPGIPSRHAISDFNSTQVFNLGFRYQTPKLTGGTRFARVVLNDWVFSGIYNARTGNPFSCRIGSDASLRDEGPQYCSFPAGGYVPLPSNRHRIDKVAEYVNVADLLIPANGTYGNSPRNYFVGPAFILPSASVRRSFAFKNWQGRSLELGVNAFNVFNTPNLGQPNTSSLSGVAAKNITQAFGSIEATVGNNAVAGTNGRRLQLSATLQF